MNETVGGMAGGGQGDPKVIGTTNDRDGDAVEPGAGGSGPDASAAGGSVATGAACPECGAGIGPADLFCEGCGAVVAVPGLTDGAGGPAGGLGTATPPNGVGRVPGDRGASGAATDPAATDPAAMDPAAGPVAPAAEGSAAEAGAAATTDQGTAAATTGPAGAAACRSCGGRVAADGYCETCGARAPRGRDHFDDRPSSWIAAVCDRGIRHGRNEDAMAVASDAEPATVGGGGSAVLVVCDGVTTSADSDVASLAAAKAAREVLLAAGPEPGQPPPVDPDARLVDNAETTVPSGPAVDPRFAAAVDRVRAAGAAANAAVIAVTPDEATGRNSPSCTLVAAVVDSGRIVVGWVGDSRAYWIPDEGDAGQLTTDDSWAAERIAMGVPREEAETGHHAHAITRWLGVDAPDTTPRTVCLEPDRSGWLLLCSDGLWNYRSDAAELAALVREFAGPEPSDPLQLAEDLVAWANGQGGHDNVTVALARIAGRAATEAEPSGV